MSFYNLIELSSLATLASYVPTYSPQLSTFPSLFFVQQESPFISNFYFYTTLNQNPAQIALQQQNVCTSGPQAVMKRGAKKRRRNMQKEIQSAKKNSESNIINQFYSFFNSCLKSEKIVQRAIKLLKKSQSQIQKIRSIFYNIIRLTDYKKGRRYVNRQSIKRFYTPQNFIKEIPEINQKLGELGIVSLEELCLLFRVCTYYFIRNISLNAVLSSKRISLVAKKQHLKRRRQILSGLEGSFDE